MIKKKDTPNQGAGKAQEQEMETGAPQPTAPETEDASLQIQALAQAAEQAMKERDEFLQLAQRLQADFDNFRRRNQAVRKDSYEEGQQDVLVKFLPVVDNLERAVAAQGDADSLREGVTMVLRQLVGVLQGEGVEEIPTEGQAFDPNLHDAVMQEEAEGVETGMVSGVLMKGYRKGEKVLRHSMVKVAP